MPADRDTGLASSAAIEMPLPLAAIQSRLGDAQDALKARQFVEVGEMLRPALLPTDAPLDDAVEWAETLAKSQHAEESDTVYDRLVAAYPGNRRVHFLFGKRLYVRGFLSKATRIFDSADEFQQGTNPHNVVLRARALKDLIEGREGRPIPEHENCRVLAMKHAIQWFANRTVEAVPDDRVGRISLVTGGLGSGGAERQLSRTAAHLSAARKDERPIGGVRLDDDIEVIVRSHSGGQRDFYLPELVEAGVETHEIDKLPPVEPSAFGIDDPELALLLDYLPHKVDFGARRLVPHFKTRRPDVVSLWQDGACLFAGLAALIAGVRKVQLVIRGLPPSIRTHMFHPDYEVMYRAMATVPGVEFVSNSKAAAQAYSDWLDIPSARFSILYNGVSPMPCRPSDELERIWSSFIEKTGDATHTVGGVFRFNVDKRPTTWIRYAIRHSRKYPDSRFLLVGDGQLLGECVELAREHGISDRICFVGHSSEVGFWLSKMDAMVLMSSFEGLPNVLIEAQYSGVPVVSTPAGGAAECFVEGETGHILNCADQTDLDEACDKVHALVERARDEALFDRIREDFLEPNFSVAGMISNFARLAAGQRQNGDGQ